MTTLTEAEIAIIRLDLGEPSACEFVTDAMIKAAWDAAGGDQCKAMASMAWWVYVRQKPSTFNLATGGQAVSTASARLYFDRWKRWADCAGVGMGSIKAGVLTLDLDAPCPDGDPSCWENWP